MADAVLYSCVRCPFAWCARLALIFAGINCQLREIDLPHKPADLLYLSPKATVPVLQLDDGRVIDESLDVMHWAVQSTSVGGLWPDENPRQQRAIRELIAMLDGEFAKNSFFFRFRRSDDLNPASYYHDRCAIFLHHLEQLLTKNRFLFDDVIGFADLAVYPFVRGFVDADPGWLVSAGFDKLKSWLALLFADARVVQSAVVNVPWKTGDNPVYLLPR